MLEMGREYKVVHQRKGQFKMFITEEDDTWITGVITEGVVPSRVSLCMVGDKITVRKSLASFELVRKE